MKAKRTWLLPVLALTLFGAACGNDDGDASNSSNASANSDDEPSGSGAAIQFTIAHIADLTGPSKSANESHVRGMDLALEALAEEGEVEITIERSDTSGDVARATSIMNEVVGNDSIVWQFGPANSGEFFAAVPIAEQLEMPITSFTSGGVYDDFNEYTFRTSFPENAAAPALVAYLQDELGAERIAAAYANDNDFARTSAENFIREAEAAGLEITTEETFSFQDISYATPAAEVAATNPDAVYIAHLNPGLLVQALVDAGLDVPIVGSNSSFHTPTNVFDTAGGKTETVRFVAPFHPDDDRPAVQDFIARFTARYPDLTPTIQEALAYDGVMMLAEAAKNVDGEITRESLREAFAEVEYSGVTGENMHFPDGMGDVSRDLSHVLILTIGEGGVAVPAED